MKTLSKSILIVDDSNCIQQMVEFTLKKAGYETMVAMDGVEALEKIKLRHIDLALVDISMPRMDGIRLVKHLQNDAQYRSLPLVVLSAASLQKAELNEIPEGVSAWVVKPFSPTHLVSVIRNVLSEKSCIKKGKAEEFYE